MTSNLGAGRESSIGFGEGSLVAYEDEVRGFFRPEFFNRLDRVVPFAPLSRDSIARIAVNELEQLARREGVTRHGLRLSWSEDFLDLLIERGFDLHLGARPLQRALETLVTLPLARYLNEKGRPEGGDSSSTGSARSPRKRIARELEWTLRLVVRGTVRPIFLVTPEASASLRIRRRAT